MTPVVVNITTGEADLLSFLCLMHAKDWPALAALSEKFRQAYVAGVLALAQEIKP